MARTVILIGIQGSGKGTQARLLSERDGFVYYEAGGMLREEAESGTKLGDEIDEIVNKRGEMVSDRVMRDLFRSRFETLNENEDVLLDGYPRKMTQVNDLEKILAGAGRENYQVFDINISDELATERLSKRVICADCKQVYVEGQYEICPKCGGPLVKREDDTPEKIAKRLSWSHQEMDPVREYYEKKGVLTTIDGSKSIEDVYATIKESLK